MTSGDNGPSSSVPSSGPAKALSMTELELRFAENPRSDVFERLCEAYLAKKRFMEAMVVCKKAGRARPEDAVPKLWLARVHAAQGRFPRAVEALEEGLKAEAEHSELLLELGRARLALDEQDLAIEAFKRSIDANAASEAGKALEALGITYPELPPPPAPEAFPSGIELSGFGSSPPSGLPISNHPSVLHRAPQRLEGEDELERLAEQVADAEARPKMGRPMVTMVLLASLLFLSAVVMGLQYRWKRQTEAIRGLSEQAVRAFDRDLYVSYKQAADALEDILSQYSSSDAKTLARLSHTYAILVHEHLETDKEDRLKEILERAKSKAPQDAHVVSAVGLVALHRGEDHQAAARRAASALLPHAAADRSAIPSLVDLTLGIAELEQGDVEAAHRRLSAVADFMRSNVRTRMWAARAAAAAGRLSTAWRYLVQVRQVEPRHPGAIANAALVSLAWGQTEKAKAAIADFEGLEFGGSRDISPKDRALAVFARSELLRREGKSNAADIQYEQARKLDPENADLPFQRGRADLQQGRLNSAVTYLQQAVEMAPSRWTFQIELAEALMLAGQKKDAKGHIDFAAQIAPNRLKVTLTKARFLRRAKDPGTEAFLKDTVLKKFPSATVEVALELGRYYRSQNELVKASEELSKAVDSFGSKPASLQGAVLVSYGLVAQAQQERGTAANAYRQAAQRGNLDALALLADLLKDGNAKEKEEALKSAQKYLASGTNLRRSQFVEKIVDKLRP